MNESEPLVLILLNLNAELTRKIIDDFNDVQASAI